MAGNDLTVKIDMGNKAIGPVEEYRLLNLFHFHKIPRIW